MSIEVRHCRNSRDREKLLAFPFEHYRGDPSWAPPFLPDLRARIDPRRGGFFRHGEADFFLAYEGTSLVGTMSAAWDRADCELRGVSEATFGFFEYRDEEIARALVESGAAWTRERGLEWMVGPFNLDHEDAYGVLLEGYDRPPTLMCGHSKPYYPKVMDALGFEPERADNIAMELRLDPPHPEVLRLERMVDGIKARGGFTVRSADFKRIDAEVDRVHSLMNRSLRHLPNFQELHRATVAEMVEPFAKFAESELVLFAEKDGECIGFLPGMPNLNETLGKLGGLRYPWQWLGLPFAIRSRARCLCIKSVLVDPSWWGRGLGPCMMGEMYRRIKDRGCDWVDLSLTSVDNQYAPILAQRFGARIYKRYRVYKKLAG